MDGLAVKEFKFPAHLTKEWDEAASDTEGN
ncbi:MAG: hypothetical protein ACI8UO_005908 [Verrucomicrobiales bacterium]|jgi:hypothetical protein